MAGSRGSASRLAAAEGIERADASLLVCGKADALLASDDHNMRVARARGVRGVWLTGGLSRRDPGGADDPRQVFVAMNGGDRGDEGSPAVTFQKNAYSKVRPSLKALSLRAFEKVPQDASSRRRVSVEQRQKEQPDNEARDDPTKDPIFGRISRQTPKDEPCWRRDPPGGIEQETYRQPCAGLKGTVRGTCKAQLKLNSEPRSSYGDPRYKGNHEAPPMRERLHRQASNTF